MSYASDHDDFEQDAQGSEQDVINEKEEFAECYFGSSVCDMSCSERADFEYQWRQYNNRKEHGK
jgi:hypothetical protein